MQIAKNMFISAALLGLFAVSGTALLAITFEATAPQIANNERAAILKALHALIPESRHDNDIFTDTIGVTDQHLSRLKKPVAVFRARKENKPVAAIISSVAPDGYNGSIYLLVAIDYDGSLAGVRVAKHRETPGLGDAIDERKSNWIHSFSGKSLANPTPDQWRVKRDGGQFDQFTGATITPRAVVKAVKNTLEYFQENRDKLFTEKPVETPS